MSEFDFGQIGPMGYAPCIINLMHEPIRQSWDPPRWRCSRCKKTTSDKREWFYPGGYLAWSARQVKEGSHASN